MRKYSRREILTLGAGGLVLLTGAGVAARLISNPKSVRAVRPTAAEQPVAALNSKFFRDGLPDALPLPLYITHNEDFYIVKYSEIPSIGLNSWSLTVHGLVRSQLRLTYDEIRGLPQHETMHTLECISNPVGGNLIGNAVWRGISFKAVLERAGIDPRARWVVIGGVDDYFTSVPLETAMHDHAMLVYEMNGATLPLSHGYPLRAILPGVYGQKQPKWITGIHVTDNEELGYWEQKGWSREAKIQLNSGIKTPLDEAQLPQHTVLIAGVAHTHETGIHAVQVSSDHGKTWNDTVLTRGPSPFVWTVWGYLWREPSPGRHVIMVRATDRAGKTQNDATSGILADVFPNGTSAIHSVLVDVRAV